jgi:hypothetical protein
VPSVHLYVAGTFCSPGSSTCYCYKCGRYTWVVMSTWSENPFNMSLSYYMGCVPSLARTRSITERSVPLANVYCAVGPGYSPFSIYQLYYSHSSTTHAALELVLVSMLFRGMCVSPIFGDISPSLAFQSPHMHDLVPSGILPMMSSI